MSPSAELQRAVYDALVADSAVAALVAGRVYDGVPKDAPFPYIVFGPSDWSRDDADCIEGRRETVQIDIWSRDQKRLRIAKEIADAVDEALHKASLVLTDNALVSIEVTRGQVMPDQDGITAHAIVEIEALVEFQ